MLRDITLGQYYPGHSIIHRLDPRVKIIGVFIYIVQLFLIKDFIGYLAVILFLTTMIILSGIKPKFIFKGLRPLILIIFLTLILNVFMTPGHLIWQYGFIKITKEGLLTALFMGLRLVLLIIGSSLLTLSTKPINLTDGIEKLLNPLKKIKVPAHELAMMMTIALRFIPTLLEETDKIMKAQMARGADFESGNIFRRAKSLTPLLVPLFVSAFRRADELAMAMEARCYRGGEKRTRMKEMRFHFRDYMAFFLLFIFLVTIVVYGRFAIPVI